MTTEAVDLIESIWTGEIEPTLFDYIRIPNVSAAFDEKWDEHGHMHDAVALVRDWCAARPIDGMTIRVQEIEGRTPLIVIDVPAFDGVGIDATDDGSDVVLLYGHLDKQPEMVGWREGLGPWTPVVENGRLYGRGGADDGYAAFASLAAIQVAQSTGMAHRRCVVLIEASEESGSPDLPAHLLELRETIGTPSLVLCLDSGCLDDQRLWATTSLRGLVSATLTVRILREGVHSGSASGVVPSTFRIIRQLLDRVEDSATGRILLPSMQVHIPEDRVTQARQTAADFPEPTSSQYPFVDGSRPMVDDPVEQLLAHTWTPTLSVTGVNGIPDVSIAGNVLRPHTSLQLSFRIPPTANPDAVIEEMTQVLTANPPYGATVELTNVVGGPGWNAPAFQPWLDAALEKASTEYFGNPARAFGEGGTIPFMGMLGEMFPDAQFVITGVLGPGSNAHGPNEFLDLVAARKVTGCLARILAEHHARS